MSRLLPAALVLSFVVLESGCDSCEKKPPAPTSSPSSVPSAPSASAASAPPPPTASVAANGADAGAKRDMGNCPTAIAGADVALKDVEGGIEVSVTAKDEPTTTEIRSRTKKLAEAVKVDAGSGSKHDHSGSGGGTTGRCTIIMRNTKLVTAEIPNGARVTVSPLDKTELDWLRRETKERDKEAKTAGAEGAGAQRMLHCPSAIEGAKTSLKDTKEGVVVTVTGPADKVAEIRERARHSADNAKKEEAARVAHSGSGTGGGATGRCPIVVEGDTTVDLKDVEGGVEATVKTKGDVAALQKEAKLRAGNFPAK